MLIKPAYILATSATFFLLSFNFCFSEAHSAKSGTVGNPIESRVTGSVHGWGGNGGNWGGHSGEYSYPGYEGYHPSYRGAYNGPYGHNNSWTNHNGWNNRGWGDRYYYGTYALENDLGNGANYYYGSPYYAPLDSYPYYSAYPTTYDSYPSSYSNFVYPSYPYNGSYYYNNYRSQNKPEGAGRGGAFIYSR